MAKHEATWQINFYEDHRGKSPVLEFINQLPAVDRAKINYDLNLLKEFGPHLGMPTPDQSKENYGSYAQEVTVCFTLCILEEPL